MCIAPQMLADGTMTACRNCWQCEQRRVDDWVGRHIAESKVSKASHVITLTYGRNWRIWEPTFGQEDHPRARVLTYSDVQKFLKRLRWHGYKFSYMVAGEYGSRHRRAHWHIIIHWHDKVPVELRNIINRRIVHWDAWIDGHVYVDRANAASVRYACKYVMKDAGDDESQSKLMMSKKPPLGARYFAKKAQWYVDNSLVPTDAFYEFPEIQRRSKKGTKEPIRFLLSGASLDAYLDEFMDRWELAKPGTHWPHSDLVNERWEKRNAGIDDRPPRFDAQPERVPFPPDGAIPVWMQKERITADEKANAYVYTPDDKEPEYRCGQRTKRRWYWVRTKEGAEWRAGIGDGRNVARLWSVNQGEWHANVAHHTKA